MAIAAVLLVGLVPMLPALLAGRMPNTHEAGRYDVLTLLFRETVAQGYAYPRWLPDLAGGFGYPTFLFYQPLFFYVSSLCSLLPGLPLAAAPFVAAGLYSLAGAAGAYAVARPIVRSRPAAVACAALFVLTPYLFVNLYVRGDNSEAAAMLLGPCPIALLMAIERRRHAGRPVIALAAAAAIVIALILTTHPAYALVYVPMLALIAATRAFAFHGNAARLRWLATLAATMAAAAALASPHWSSVFQHARYVHLDRALVAQYRPEVNLFPISRLLTNRWGHNWVDAPTTPTSAPISVQLGVPLVLLAIAGAWLARRRPWVAPMAIACALLILAMTPLSAPFWASAANPFRRIQFPWRLLAVLAAFQLPLICRALAAAPPRHRATLGWAAVAVTLVWLHPMFRIAPPGTTDAPGGAGRGDLSWHDASEFFRRTRDGLRWSGYAFAAAREFDPIWARLTPAPRGDLPIIATGPESTVRPLPGDSAHRIRAEIVSPAASAFVIRQFYFPGWRVAVNGVDVPDQTLRADVTEEGLMAVALPAGTSQISASFEGPPHWLPRSLLAAAIVVGCGVALRRLDRAGGPAA